MIDDDSGSGKRKDEPVSRPMLRISHQAVRSIEEQNNEQNSKRLRKYAAIEKKIEKGERARKTDRRDQRSGGDNTKAAQQRVE
jgi:hypothetical protein